MAVYIYIHTHIYLYLSLSLSIALSLSLVLLLVSTLVHPGLPNPPNFIATQVAHSSDGIFGSRTPVHQVHGMKSSFFPLLRGERQYKHNFSGWIPNGRTRETTVFPT